MVYPLRNYKILFDICGAIAYDYEFEQEQDIWLCFAYFSLDWNGPYSFGNL